VIVPVPAVGVLVIAVGLGVLVADVVAELVRHQPFDLRDLRADAGIGVLALLTRGSRPRRVVADLELRARRHATDLDLLRLVPVDLVLAPDLGEPGVPGEVRFGHALQRLVECFELGLPPVHVCSVGARAALVRSLVRPTTPSYAGRTLPFLKTRAATRMRSEEHTSELQSLTNLVCRLLLANTRPA